MRFTVTFLIIASMFFAPAARANTTFWEILFPSLRNIGPSPSETLTAPFALEDDENAAQKTDDEERPQMPENLIAMDQPHRTQNALNDWAITATSKALTFSENAYEEHIKEMDMYFSPRGKAQYLDFLRTMNIERTAKSSQFEILSYVSRTPLLINKGAIDGTYRWLFDIRLKLTVVQKGFDSYSNDQPVTREFRIRSEIGRNKNAQNPDEMWIETWNGKIIEPQA